MTYTMQAAPTSTPPRLKARRQRTWLLALGLAAIALVALGVGLLVSRGTNSPSTSTAATQQLASSQLTSVQQSCQQWSGSAAPTVGNSSANAAAWCTTMTGWMGQQLRNGHITGAMMWGSAATLQSTCQQWMATGSDSTGAGTASPTWCGGMAGWMAQHVGSWGNWMMNGNMMGG